MKLVTFVEGDRGPRPGLVVDGGLIDLGAEGVQGFDCVYGCPAKRAGGRGEIEVADPDGQSEVAGAGSGATAHLWDWRELCGACGGIGNADAEGADGVYGAVVVGGRAGRRM